MGYYSNVAIAVSEPHFNEFKSYIDSWYQKATADNTDEKTVRDAKATYDFILKHSKIKKGENPFVSSQADFIVIEWNNIKWYDCFPEVKMIMEHLVHKYPDASFLRIGEEWDDVEEINNEFFWVDTSIGYDSYNYTPINIRTVD